MCGEMGRTPCVNAGTGESKVPGRDNWGAVQTVFLAGGAIRQGIVVGASDTRLYRCWRGPSGDSCWSRRRFVFRPTSEPRLKPARLAPRDFRPNHADVRRSFTRAAAGEVTPPAAGCTCAHLRPGFPSLGCVPVEPNSVSRGYNLRSQWPHGNVHLDTCDMPLKVLRR